jgi:hypothetical protein
VNAPYRISADQADALDQPWRMTAPNAYQLMLDLIDLRHMCDAEVNACFTLMRYLKRREQDLPIPVRLEPDPVLVWPATVAPSDFSPSAPDDGLPKASMPGGKAEDDGSGGSAPLPEPVRAVGVGVVHKPRESSEVVPVSGVAAQAVRSAPEPVKPEKTVKPKLTAHKLVAEPTQQKVPDDCVLTVNMPKRQLVGPKGAYSVREGMARVCAKLGPGYKFKINTLRLEAPAHFPNNAIVLNQLREHASVFDALGVELREDSAEGTEVSVRLVRQGDKSA